MTDENGRVFSFCINEEEAKMEQTLLIFMHETLRRHGQQGLELGSLRPTGVFSAGFLQ